MLTRLQVSGFKNLVDVDVRFGPFTCVAGANGVGKSNLLDAIAFLSALAERPLVDAALSVRDEERRTGDIGSIFHRVGERQDTRMSLVAEMLIPQSGVDDLGQVANATTSFLRYTLELAYKADELHRGSIAGLEILREELTHIRNKDARKELAFPVDHSWYETAISGRRWTRHYISTKEEPNGARVINVHQDGGSSGKPRPLLAANLPRTAISAANAAESPTATLVKREMQSWKRLQLEPSALRRPDPLIAPSSLGSDGSHLPATLYRLASGAASGAEKGRIYATIGNRLSQLIDDVSELYVDKDEKRELLTVKVRGKDGTGHPARSLSDGTLRFLALATLELDPAFQGVLCLEEPENGIHPARIPAILQLLQDIATDVSEPVGPDNPLRQVIVNTHSPSVVAQVPEQSLLFANTAAVKDGNETYNKLVFSCMPSNWRLDVQNIPTISKGELLSYLSPVTRASERDEETQVTPVTKRVIDNSDIQLLMFGSEDDAIHPAN